MSTGSGLGPNAVDWTDLEATSQIIRQSSSILCELARLHEDGQLQLLLSVSRWSNRVIIVISNLN